jgi:hypothetical protein
VAPPLPDLLRKILEGRKIQNKTIDHFLSRNKSLKRYSSSFKLLWETLVLGGIDPPQATSDQIVDSIIQIFQISPSQARNAYSAVLLIPGVGEGVRFHPLLSPYKKDWNKNIEKYASFWDPLPLLRALQAQSLDTLKRDISSLRTQLILCCRLLCLYRSSDLANLQRVVSVLGKVPYIKIRRKGQKIFKWERVVSLPQFPQISPFHLLQLYVSLTRKMGKPGGPVLLTLKPPYRALTPKPLVLSPKMSCSSLAYPPKFGALIPPGGLGLV